MKLVGRVWIRCELLKTYFAQQNFFVSHLRKPITVIAEIFVRDLISYFAYFWMWEYEI